MYSFLPKLSQQLAQLAKIQANKANQNTVPPEGPGDIYKNLIEGGTSDSYYRKYNNEWTVYDNDNKGWKSLPPSYPEMLNNRITTDKGKQALYTQGNPEYAENALMYDPTASLDERTRALKYKELDKYRNETGVLPTGIIPELGYNPYFDNQFLPGMNMPNQIIAAPKKALSPDDMGGAGVMANTGPEPTPYLDQVMGKNNKEPTIPYLQGSIPIPNIKSPEPLEYDPSTGLPIQKKFNQNALPDFGLTTEDPKVSLDIFPYKDDVEYIRSQRQQEPEIKDDPEFRKKYNNALAALSPSIKLMTGIDPSKFSDDGDISKLRGDYEGDVSLLKSNMEGDGDMSYVKPDPKNPLNPTNPLVQTPKNKFGTPEAYYLGKSMLDATALINNMVQPQPPSIQMKLPHYERQRLNPEPYDTMRSEMRNQGTQAYRLQRENISQASDLMKGLAAVTSGTQQGLMQVGMQQAGAEQQIQGINQQISMQEQSAQTQILNQEATTNYQIQAQAQQFKDQMISAQLARLGDTAGAYAKYANMKEISTKQDIVNKAAIQSNNEIQNAMLQYQLQKDAMDSDEYKSSWSQHWNKRLDQMAIDKLSDQKYNLVKEYYGESTPRYGDYQRRAMDPVFVNDYYTKKNSADMFQKLYPGGVAPDRTKYTTDADYNAAVADFQRYQKDYNAYNTDKSYKTFEQEQDFWSAISNEKNEAAERKIFADTYMKDRGIFTSEQFMAAIQSSLERSRQSLEIGG